ncbi:hypothetical protein QW131_14430 [Roseibium salinum]|nr:hypothetical protein [Roseibium salinum]
MKEYITMPDKSQVSTNPINRRNMLTGSAAALSTLAVTNLPASAADNPDAKLKELFKLYEHAVERMNTADREMTELFKIVDKELPYEPPMPKDIDDTMPPDVQEAFNAMTFGQFARKDLPEIYNKWHDDLEERQRQAKEEYQAYEETHARLKEKYNIGEFEDRADRCFGEYSELRYQIFETPAQTLEGVKIKNAGDRA